MAMLSTLHDLAMGSDAPQDPKAAADVGWAWRFPCHRTQIVQLKVVSDWDHYSEVCPTCSRDWFVTRRTVRRPDGSIEHRVSERRGVA